MVYEALVHYKIIAILTSRFLGFLSEFNVYGLQSLDCSCTTSNLSWFFVGLILGVSPMFIYFAVNTLKRRKLKIPSSPHYITAATPLSTSNHYVTVPVKDKSQLKLSHSHCHNGSGTIRSKFDFDMPLKRSSSELKNGHAKQYYEGDNHLYE